MTGDGQLLIAPERVAQAQAKVARLITELRRVILGKEQTIDEVVAALLARGHVLLEGLPGLGKTELVKALSRLLSLDFRRIQFTPDLLPTDITGSHILQEREGRKEFVFHPGPVFTNVLLADEINRASPKTQAALLEAMQEHRVTTFGVTRPLPEPFFVLATQNPIELEGTYPLPEAQLDRFMFKVDIAGVERSVLEEILVDSRARRTPGTRTGARRHRPARYFRAGRCGASAERCRRLHRAARGRVASGMRRRTGDRPQLRQAWQLAHGPRSPLAPRRAGWRCCVGNPTSGSTKSAAWPHRRWPIGWCSTTRHDSKAGTAGASWPRCSRRSRRSKEDSRRPWKRGDCGNGWQTTAPPVAVLRPGPWLRNRVRSCRRRISDGRDRITQDRDRYRVGGANRSGLSARPIRDHQPRRGARCRNSRSGQPIFQRCEGDAGRGHRRSAGGAAGSRRSGAADDSSAHPRHQ